MDLIKISKSSFLKIILIILTTLIVVLLIFWLGLIVGFKKAEFSCRWEENYHQNFAGPRPGSFFKEAALDFGARNLMPHGIFGQIIKIDASSSLVIKGQDDMEKIITLNNKTSIQRQQESIDSNQLKLDDYVVVIGEPDEAGQIAAKFIRVMPQPPLNNPLPLFP